MSSNYRLQQLVCVMSLLVLLGTGAQRVQAQAEPTAAEWRADLFHLVRTLESQHPNLYHSTPEADFNDIVDSLYQNIPGMQRHQIVVGFAKLAAMVGDAHTVIHLSNGDIGFSEVSDPAL